MLTILSRFDLKIEETNSNILNQRSEKQVTIVNSYPVLWQKITYTMSHGAVPLKIFPLWCRNTTEMIIGVAGDMQ